MGIVEQSYTSSAALTRTFPLVSLAFFQIKPAEPFSFDVPNVFIVVYSKREVHIN